jgi:hypothetical protein
MIRFASLDTLIRIFITGLILIAVFGLARSSPSALRSYEGPALKGAPTPSVARLFVASGARLIAGPRASTFRWSNLVDDSVELSRQPAQTGNQAGGESGPALQREDSGHKAHGGSAE